MNHNSQYEIMRVDEVSDEWNRCCCRPFHPFKLEVRKFIPLPGNWTSNDYDHLQNDLRNNYNHMNLFQKSQTMREMYMTQDPLFTIVRHNGQRCCKVPCKCLSCCIFFSWCQDGATLYIGMRNSLK